MQAILIAAYFLLLTTTATAASMEGYSSFRNGNYSAALRQFESDPMKDPVSAYFRALIYLSPDSEFRNQKKGLELLKIAANGTYPPACYLFGTLLLYGNGLNSDQKAATAMLLVAAEDDYRAAVLLRIIEKKRRKESIEHEAVVSEVKKSAKKGNPLAQYTLGFMYLIGDGVPQNSKNEAYWYKEAAARYPRASFMLALMHYYGDGIEQSPSKAFYFMQLGAKQGDLRSAYYLGTFHYHGVGTKVDHTSAANWFKSAADRGDSEAQVALALLLLSGDGIKQDKSSALDWLGKSARQENRRAKDILKELLTYRGTPSSKTLKPLQTIPEIHQKNSENNGVKLEGNGLILDQGVFGLKFSLPTMYDAYAPRTQQEIGARQIWERLQGGTFDIIIRPTQK